jgi:hypothetical protein
MDGGNPVQDVIYNSVESIKVKYREYQSGEYTNEIDAEYDANDNSVVARAFIPNNVIDANKSYDFKIVIDDQIDCVSEKNIMITYAFCTMDFRAGGKGVAIGKYSDEDIFDVDMPSKFRKELEVVEINGYKYGENQILWSGADDDQDPKFMNEDQTVVFNYDKREGEFHRVSEQPHGIVLVFSLYDKEDKDSANASWSCHFVPKSMIGTNGLGKGGSHTFLMATFTDTVDAFGIKHLYIDDTSITGHIRNGMNFSESNASACGIKYSNAKYALVYVLGV